MTYYILAAQTIHFKVLLLNETSFSQIIRDQRELDAEQSIKVWQSYIQETSNFINCKSLTESFSKYGHFVNAVTQTISNQRG